MKFKHLKEAGPNDPIYKSGLTVGGNYLRESSPVTKAETSTDESPKPETNSSEPDAQAKENKD